MTRIEQTTLDVYAQDYWAKERRKIGKMPQYSDDLVKSIHAVKQHYKLPNPDNGKIWVVELDQPDEILNLRIHKYMLEDDWMKRYEINIPPSPDANKLENG